VRHGTARPGMARRDEVWLARLGGVGFGMVWLGRARYGLAG
jgi:hypothetical protein